MKLTKLLTVTAIAMVAMSHSAYANNAKFQKIERQLTQCVNQVYSSSGVVGCLQGAISEYQAVFTKSQKSQFKKRKQTCIAQYGDPQDFNLSAAEAVDSLDCMYKAAKAVSKRK